MSENQRMDITSIKDGGVLKEVINEGLGSETPFKGSKVSVHYVGTLEDGIKFDSSRDRGEHFEFTLGKGEVIKAWDIGVSTMKKGEISKFICKSEYAYGSRGSPPKIPANATLIFEIELFDWSEEDLSIKKDRGILRRLLKEGSGFQSPNSEAIVEVHIQGRIGDHIFDERDLSFNLGDGASHNIPDGLDKALERFKINEKSIITLNSKNGFGASGNVSLNVPPNATIQYEVELKNFTRAKETWEMDLSEKLGCSRSAKTDGTKYFKQGNYRQAIKQYKKIISYLQHESGLSEEESEEIKALIQAAHLNLCLCHLKINNFLSVIEHADKVIDEDNVCVKAYFRRGQAWLNIEEAKKAKVDFEKCLSLESDNKVAAQQIKLCNAKLEQQKLNDKKIYAGMFDKFAKVDSKRNRKAGNDVESDVGEWEKKCGVKQQELKDDLKNLDNNIEMI